MVNFFFFLFRPTFFIPAVGILFSFRRYRREHKANNDEKIDLLRELCRILMNPKYAQ